MLGFWAMNMTMNHTEDLFRAGGGENPSSLARLGACDRLALANKFIRDGRALGLCRDRNGCGRFYYSLRYKDVGGGRKKAYLGSLDQVTYQQLSRAIRLKRLSGRRAQMDAVMVNRCVSLWHIYQRLVGESRSLVSGTGFSFRGRHLVESST